MISKFKFPGIYKSGKEIATLALTADIVYGEKIIRDGNKIYRVWDPTRSKLAAGVRNDLKYSPFDSGTKVLYLGASTGTTVSHISDIIGSSGIVYAIEFAERVFRPLLDLSKKRKNIAPLLADARKPENYAWIEECDVIFCDVAQPEETEIAIRNAKQLLKQEGYLFLSVKSQSINVTKNPQQVYEEEKNKLKKAGFTIIDLVDLEPYEQKHALILAKK